MDNEVSSMIVAPVVSSDALVEYKDACRKRIAEAHAALAAALSGLGVGSVTANYDGSGDSGQLDEVHYWDKDGVEMKSETVGDLHEHVSEFLYDLVEVRHGGYENNEGGGGEFRWDLTAEGLLHEHWDYYIERDCSAYEGLV
jgi:hypothetical protein